MESTNLESSKTDLATYKPVVDHWSWLVGIAFWIPVAIMVAMLVFHLLRRPPVHRQYGEALVNNQGTVIVWTDKAESVTGRDRRSMVGDEVFRAVPEERRHDVRREFTKAVDGKPYSFPVTYYPACGKQVKMEFVRRSESMVSAIFSRMEP